MFVCCFCKLVDGCRCRLNPWACRPRLCRIPIARARHAGGPKGPPARPARRRAQRERASCTTANNCPRGPYTPPTHTHCGEGRRIPCIQYTVQIKEGVSGSRGAGSCGYGGSPANSPRADLQHIIMGDRARYTRLISRERSQSPPRHTRRRQPADPTTVRTHATRQY